MPPADSGGRVVIHFFLGEVRVADESEGDVVCLSVEVCVTSSDFAALCFSGVVSLPKTLKPECYT